MIALALAACERSLPPPAPSRGPLAPPRPCSTTPDAVIAALGARHVVSVADIGDVVASLGPDARCPVASGPDGWSAAIVADPPAVVVLHGWPGGPSEVNVERPLPLDAEHRIAGSARWLVSPALGPLEGWVGAIPRVDLDRARSGPTLQVDWCVDASCSCSELVWGFDADLQHFWSCPGRPAPSLPPGAVPWPTAADRE
jgi:hypothetical protein